MPPVFMPPLLYLASCSPRRRELLQQIGVSHEVIDVDIDETPLPNESGGDYVCRMALEKARVGAAICTRQPMPILAADTDVVLDGQILGKPMNEAEAIAMLRGLSGRSHQVFSAVALLGDKERVLLNESRVHFRPLNEAEILAYCRTGEPYGKAGGYGIQGKAAAFISRLEGSYSGVMGLPLYETAELLRSAGIFDLTK